MARGPQQVTLWPGILAAFVIAALILGTLAIVAAAAPKGRSLGPSDLAAVRFTVSQALLSASLSIIAALPVARALSRQSHKASTHFAARV